MDDGERHALCVCKHHLLLAGLAVVPGHAVTVIFLLVAEAGSQRFVELLFAVMGAGPVHPVLGPLQVLVVAEEASKRRRRMADVEPHSHIHRHYWAGHR